MLEFALKNEVTRSVKEVFGTRKVSYDTETVYVDSDTFRKTLDNSLYFLINDKLDIPTTAKIVIQSQNNMLITTKDAYNGIVLKPFRGYLQIKTLNYGVEFTPFSLTFLKVTPYE